MEAPTLERKLVAILAADVEGYSRLMAADEEAALASLSRHRAVVDELIAEFRGRIANTAGDSVLAEFASVVDAVRCAVRMQEATAELQEAEAGIPPMRFRIGVNVGDVMVKDGDIFGDGVNIAARLQTLAEAGGICVSRGVRDQIRHLGAFRFDDLGEQKVKNIARPVRAFRVIADGTAAEAPPADTPPDPAAVAAAMELASWQAASRNDDVASYLDFLEQFPDGEMAAMARNRIAALSKPQAPALDADTMVELTFWDSVKDSDNPAMLEAYLERYPDGEFTALARAKLDELAASDDA